MEPGNYFGNVNPESDEPKRLRGTRRLESEPTPRDRIKRAEFRKFLKVRTLVFVVLAVIFLAIGLPLAIVFRANKGNTAWAIGILFSILGGVCTLIFLIYLPIFMRVMASRSEMAAHQPRTAEALRESPYPRQVEVSDMPQPPLTATNPHYNPAVDPLLQTSMPELDPSAPPLPLPPLPTEHPPRYDYIQGEQQQRRV